MHTSIKYLIKMLMLINKHLTTLFRLQNPHLRCTQAKVKMKYIILAFQTCHIQYEITNYQIIEVEHA